MRIEPATSLFIILHPACDAIVRKQTKNVEQMLLELFPSKLVFSTTNGDGFPHRTGLYQPGGSLSVEGSLACRGYCN